MQTGRGGGAGPMVAGPARTRVETKRVLRADRCGAAIYPGRVDLR